MADAQAPTHQSDDGSPYLTFTELRVAGRRVPLFSKAYERLIWPIRGEFPAAISVMEGTLDNPGNIEPLFNAETREWHEIASQPITTEKVSGLEASLTDLDLWDWKWVQFHEDHADPARDSCEYVTYGDLDNDVRPWAEEPEREDGSWSWDEPSDTEILVRCCGQDRPLRKKGLTLEVRPSPGNAFVTVKDYVGTVHPWLMGMQDDIIRAMRMAEPGYPPSTEWRLSTTCDSGPAHRIMLPEEWNGSMRTVLIDDPEEVERINRMLHPEISAALPPNSVLMASIHI